MKTVLFILSCFLLATAYAENGSVAVSPIVLPGYTNLVLSGEYAAEPNHTFGMNLNYNSHHCDDCKNPGYSYGKGAGAFYRVYTDDFNVSNWFTELGIRTFSAKVKDTQNGATKDKTIDEGTLFLGRRKVFKQGYYVDFYGGMVVRSNKIRGGQYTPYTAST